MGRVGLSPDSFTTFGTLLKVLRRRVRLTQDELGAAVGYSGTYITRLEGDARLPNPNTVRALFVDALKLQDEPELARRLIELADTAHRQTRPSLDSLATAGSAPDQNVSHPALRLPAQLTSFVGRSHELSTVIGLLGASRLVTLTGSGGVGKTRLALEAGATLAVAPDFDRVWWAELAPLMDPSRVADVVATALGLSAPNRPALDVLVEYLRNRHSLLLLDNCEHLIQASAELAEALLRACPDLHILATSRERLNVQGEVTWRVPSLSAEETLQLFAVRARTARPGFVLDGHTSPAVTAICRKLDGIPLAIELAAARLNSLSVGELARRLGDSYLLLTGGSRTVLPRHQTLRATIDWSYGLLSELERGLLRRLSVFAGSWTAEAVEQMFAHLQETPGQRQGGNLPVTSFALSETNALPLLLSLIDKSLIVVDERDGEMRYRLLDTIRQFAWEQLAACGETDDACRQHARYYLALVQETAPREMRESASPVHFALLAETSAWRERLHAERDNLRAALAWGLRDAREPQDVDKGVQLALWLYPYWSMHGPHREGREWIERALARTDPVIPTQTRARLLCVLANFAGDTGDGALAEAASREALAICREMGNRFDLMIALWCGTNRAMKFGDAAEAMAVGEEWLSTARELDNQRCIGVALFWLGTMALHRNELSHASVLMEESLRVLPVNEVGVRVTARFSQGMLALCQGDDATAADRCDEALAYYQQASFAFGVATVLHMMGDIALFRGDGAQAGQHYRQSLTILHHDGARQRALWCLEGLAALAAMERHDARATTMWAAGDALRAGSGSIDTSIRHSDYRARVDIARSRLDGPARAMAEAAGRAMSFEDAVTYALG